MEQAESCFMFVERKLKSDKCCIAVVFVLSFTMCSLYICICSEDGRRYIQCLGWMYYKSMAFLAKKIKVVRGSVVEVEREREREIRTFKDKFYLRIGSRKRQSTFFTFGSLVD